MSVGRSPADKLLPASLLGLSQSSASSVQQYLPCATYLVFPLFLDFLGLLCFHCLLRVLQCMRRPQLGYQILTLLASLVHLILSSSTTQDTLQQHNGTSSLPRFGG
jgi:hypothetical protein